MPALSVLDEGELASRHIDCESCGAPSGELCVNTDNSHREASWPHFARLLTYRLRHQAQPRRCTKGDR